MVNFGFTRGAERMLRTKPPKKKKEERPKLSTHFIMSVIMPCVMLACKDEFKIKDQARLDKLGRRIQGYINRVADGSVSVEELHTMMECKDAK